MVDSLFEHHGPQIYSQETAKNKALAVGFTLSSLLITVLYMCILDFAQSYVVPPKHFPKRGWSQLFFKPKVNAPLVEPKPGSKDFKKVLKQGSDEVSRLPMIGGDTGSIPLVPESDETSSIRTNLTESRIIPMNGSLYHSR